MNSLLKLGSSDVSEIEDAAVICAAGWRLHLGPQGELKIKDGINAKQKRVNTVLIAFSKLRKSSQRVDLFLSCLHEIRC